MTPTKEETKAFAAILEKYCPNDGIGFASILMAFNEWQSQSKPQEPSLPKALEDMLIEKYPIESYEKWMVWQSFIFDRELNKARYKHYVDEVGRKRTIATQFYLAGVESKEKCVHIPKSLEGKYSVCTKCGIAMQIKP